MENDPKVKSPEEVVTGISFDLKAWKELLEVLGLGLLFPGIVILWGYAFFVAHFTPSGLTEWFPILYASFNLTVTLVICLGFVTFVGGLVATFFHGAFFRSRNNKGVPGFRLNDRVEYLGFWLVFALMILLIFAWLIGDVATVPWRVKLPIMMLNLLSAYCFFRIWKLDLQIKDDASRGKIWNRAKPYLWKFFLFFVAIICFSGVDHGFPQKFVERGLVMSGVRSDWTRLRVSGTHLEPLKRKSRGKLDLILSKEGDQSFLYFDRGRVLFQRLGTDSLLELVMSDGKPVRYRLPSSDVREIGYLENE